MHSYERTPPQIHAKNAHTHTQTQTPTQCLCMFKYTVPPICTKPSRVKSLTPSHTLSSPLLCTDSSPTAASSTRLPSPNSPPLQDTGIEKAEGAARECTWFAVE